MQDTEIYVKTEAGRDEIRSRALGLPMSVRAILLMIDGQRTVAAMRALIAGSKAPSGVLEDLVSQGLIEPRGGAVEAAAPPAPAPAVSAPAVPAPPVAAAATPSPSPPAVAPPPAAVARPSEDTVTATMRSLESASILSMPLDTASLDLVLPTIFGPESAGAEAAPVDAPRDVPPQHNRYEHLYAMMNEVVRDFLAPHRRYFFQLKIERCGTAEELLELLHDLQSGLAKARGEAFASDVIARLRSAAG